jgi:hypothetical protein
VRALIAAEAALRRGSNSPSRAATGIAESEFRRRTSSASSGGGAAAASSSSHEARGRQEQQQQQQQRQSVEEETGTPAGAGAAAAAIPATAAGLLGPLFGERKCCLILITSQVDYDDRSALIFNSVCMLQLLALHLKRISY